MLPEGSHLRGDRTVTPIPRPTMLEGNELKRLEQAEQGLGRPRVSPHWLGSDSVPQAALASSKSRSREL